MTAKRHDVLGFGVAAVDDLLYVPAYPPANVKVSISRSARHAGGLACTAIAAAGQLGGDCAYAARLGSDELSTFIKSALAGRNVDISAIIADEQAQPFHSIIVVDNSGSRTIFYDASRFQPLAADDLSASLLTQARVIFLDYLVDPPVTALAQKIRKLGIPMLADVEGRSEACLPLLPLIDHLIVSEEFARWVAKTDDLQAACAYLAQTPRAATVVTAGSQGCYLSTAWAPEPQHIPAFKIEAVDTNGCGDTFHGAFALAIARQLSPQDGALFATAAAALKARGPGGWSSLPSASELLAFLRQQLPPAQQSRALMQCVMDLIRPG